MPASVWAERPSDPVLSHCIISIKHEVQVPAQEPGVLIRIKATEGMPVQQGELLARIDDSQRQIEKQQALIDQRAAKEQAENEINVLYATAAARVAEAEYQQALDANRKVPGTFPETEVRRLRLAWHRSALQIEQSKHEKEMASFAVESRASDVKAAETNIIRRRIESPVDGEIVAVFRHAGEWVNPGDPVLRIIGYNTLRIEGFLNARQYDPIDVTDRPVTVQVELARGRHISLRGKITYVSSLVQAGGDYRVWAEVSNRKQEGQWVLRPGLEASMTIHLGETMISNAASRKPKLQSR